MEGLSGRASSRPAPSADFGAAGGLSGLGVVPHGAHETKTLARQRLDQPLFLAGVADGGAGRIQAGRQRRVRHARPFQMALMRSSLVTTCSRWRMR